MDHLPTQVCLQKVVFLTYSWVINDKMDTILPIASSTWTFSTLNMDKIGLIVLQKRNQQNHSTENIQQKNTDCNSSYKALPRIMPAPGTLLWKWNLVILVKTVEDPTKNNNPYEEIRYQKSIQQNRFSRKTYNKKKHATEKHTAKKHSTKKHASENHSVKKHASENHSAKKHTAEKVQDQENIQQKIMQQKSMQQKTAEDHLPEKHMYSQTVIYQKTYCRKAFTRKTYSQRVIYQKKHSVEKHSPEKHTAEKHSQEKPVFYITYPALGSTP